MNGVIAETPHWKKTDQKNAAGASGKLTNSGANSSNLLLFSPLTWEPNPAMPKRNQTRCGIAR